MSLYNIVGYSSIESYLKDTLHDFLKEEPRKASVILLSPDLYSEFMFWGKDHPLFNHTDPLFNGVPVREVLSKDKRKIEIL